MSRCYVTVYSTMTIDGKIASKTRYSKLSCPHDLRRLHELRAQSDGVMVGANTVLIDDPSLRLKYVEGRDPARIVVDGLLRTPLEARVYTLKTAEAIVLTTEAAPRGKAEALREMGVKVLVFPGPPPIDMRAGVERLYGEGLRRIMVEGGGELLWHLFAAGVVDELRLTIAPYVFGGRDAVGLVMGEGFETTEDARKMRLVDVKVCECGQEVHLRYLRAWAINEEEC
ncbi:MAG: 2,5-diamino-6-(ribosylamino)-4(3H)-pyrimidinone 5'-phosphate reductase [Candidatus Nezhaarchaeota archaeon]|nr:2,5-diamino-6-(ribosylamino)-4(3H)-pyrimidinone 5'-phosphate reductase [Candidatus Nezhaarchaeota archaeon]